MNYSKKNKLKKKNRRKHENELYRQYGIQDNSILSKERNESFKLCKHHPWLINTIKLAIKIAEQGP